jgi:hypothetical protein
MEKKETLVAPKHDSTTINQDLSYIHQLMDQEPYNVTITNGELAQQAVKHYNSKLKQCDNECKRLDAIVPNNIQEKNVLDNDEKANLKKLLCVCSSLILLRAYPKKIDTNDLLLRKLKKELRDSGEALKEANENETVQKLNQLESFLSEL